MQRYFLETPFDDLGNAVVKGEDQKHMTNVMRMSIDDEVIAVSNGEAFLSKVVDISVNSVKIQKTGNALSSNELPIVVTIACGLAKGDKHELIVQKSTELGVSSIIQFKAERSIVKWDDRRGAKKVERLRKIAKQAAEQCHRTLVPEIEGPISLNALIELSSNYDLLLFADEEDAKSNEPHRISDRVKKLQHNQKVLAVFGPEGGLSRNEAKLLLAAGFLPVALGPRILRTETAPLYLLSVMSYEFE